MFRSCTKRLAVSMFSLFLVEQKNNPVLKNLPVIKRGKLLGKLYRSLSPEDRAALEYRASRTKAWKRSKKKKTAKVNNSHNKTGVHHYNKQISYHNTRSYFTPKPTTSNNANKAFSLNQFVRDYYQEQQQKYKKLQNNKKSKAHQRISQIAHSWKNKNTATNKKVSKTKAKTQHVKHSPYSSHKLIKRHGQSHKKGEFHSSRSTTARHTHKSLARKHKTSASRKFTKKSHMSHRPKHNIAKRKSNNKKHSTKKSNAHKSKLNKQHRTHRKK